ncbi:MAG: FecR domain-containing protein, partial [Verrucomicrobiota bacterium]
MTPELKQHLLDLADHYIEGTLTAEQAEQVDRLIANTPEARQVFSDYLHDHAAQYWQYISQNEKPQLPQFEAPSKLKIWALPFIASCLAVLCAFFIFKPNGATPVAEIIRAEGPDVSKGDQIHLHDSLAISEGLVELVFPKTGVHVIATAPLDISDVDHSFMRLNAGEVKLHVPPQGIGFVVETDQKRITDLGTSFVVSADQTGSSVFVLDGQIAIDGATQAKDRLLNKGEFASFHSDGTSQIKKQSPFDIPEINRPDGIGGLQGRMFTLKSDPNLPARNTDLLDLIGSPFIPLIESRFTDQSSLANLRAIPKPIYHTGLAGSFRSLTDDLDIGKFPNQYGWMAWYSGKVKPPQKGRYRFWGYADNHLLVAINGKPVLEGSRFDTSFRNELKGIKRRNHPAFPCLNAQAGISAGQWIEVGNNPVQIDILFGEMSNTHTFGLLLIER